MKELSVHFKNEYDQPVCVWEKLENETDSISYVLSLENPSNGDILHEEEVQYERYVGTSWLAYYCQEKEYFGKLIYKVKAYDDNKLIAEGESEAFEANVFFPEKKELVIGKDIPSDAITQIEYSGSGSSVEHIFRYTIMMDGTIDMSYFGPNGSVEKEKAISEQDWNQVLAIIETGSLKRRYIMDPNIEMLDGSEKRLTIEWEGKAPRDSYYEVVFDESAQERFNSWIEKIRS